MHSFDIIDSDSEFESDVSYDRPRRPILARRRSFSRRRHRSPESNSYLSPDVIQTVHRSASTGGRRRRDPAVVINNEIRAKQMHKERRGRPLHSEVDEYEEVDVLRPRGRPRAGSSLSRTSSPHHRDWELLMDQRLLERNDRRQDIELMKHKQEIERLERQFARSHEHVREPRYTEDWEDELIERLRRLDRLERSKRVEEERRLAEYREKVKKLEEMERKAAEEEGARRLAREKYLKELEKKEALRAEKERIKKELRDEEARRLLEEEERKKELAKIKAAAVEEYKRAEEAKKLREIEEKERKDKEFKARLKEEFGCSEEQLEALIKKQKEKEKDKEREREREKPHSPPEPPTYIKVRNEHSPNLARS